MSSSPDESPQTTSKIAHALDPELSTQRGLTLEEVLALEAT